MNAKDRFKTYTGSKCWQAHIADVNFEQDLADAGLTRKGAESLRTGDFYFEYVDKIDKAQCGEIKQFIERHEWLGKLPNRPTHRFTARLKSNGHLAGTIIMATPNAFSNLLGAENRDKEKLISRGACISWAPKNLGSWLIMRSVKWMVAIRISGTLQPTLTPKRKSWGPFIRLVILFILGKLAEQMFSI